MFIKKIINKETLSYAVCGVFTMVLGIAVYQLLLYAGMYYQHANLISLIVGKLAAYLCNKIIVFKVFQSTFLGWLKEFGRFVIARGATFFIDYFGVIVAVELLGWDEVLSKYFFVAVVLVLNYIFGKVIVFKKTLRKPVAKDDVKL